MVTHYTTDYAIGNRVVVIDTTTPWVGHHGTIKRITITESGTEYGVLFDESNALRWYHSHALKRENPA